MPVTQRSRIAVDDSRSVAVTIVNVIAVMVVRIAVVMVMGLFLIPVMMMAVIIMVVMNVGMVPAMMSMPGHGCEILLAQWSLVHETQRAVELDDSRVGAESLRDQRSRRIAQAHALRGFPSHRESADKSRAVGIATS